MAHASGNKFYNRQNQQGVEAPCWFLNNPQIWVCEMSKSILPKDFYVYIHCRNDTGAAFYVGKGKGSRAHNITKRNLHWRRIVLKHGHTVIIAKYFECEKEAFAHEKLLIASFRVLGVQLCNRTDGGEGISGHHHNAETRAKIRISRKGKTHSSDTKAKISFAGKSVPKSNAHRDALSLSQKGVPRGALSNEQKLKMSVSHTGKIHSDVTKAKMSASHKGRIVSLETKAKIRAAQIARFEKTKKPL